MGLAFIIRFAFHGVLEQSAQNQNFRIESRYAPRRKIDDSHDLFSGDIFSRISLGDLRAGSESGPASGIRRLEPQLVESDQGHFSRDRSGVMS